MAGKHLTMLRSRAHITAAFGLAFATAGQAAGQPIEQHAHADLPTLTKAVEANCGLALGSILTVHDRKTIWIRPTDPKNLTLQQTKCILDGVERALGPHRNVDVELIGEDAKSPVRR